MCGPEGVTAHRLRTTGQGWPVDVLETWDLMILPFTHDFLPLYSTMTISQIVRLVFLYYCYYFHGMYVCMICVCVCVWMCVHMYMYMHSHLLGCACGCHRTTLDSWFSLSTFTWVLRLKCLNPSHQSESSILTACFLPLYIQLYGRALFLVYWICK